MCLSVIKALRKSAGKKVPVALLLIMVCFSGLFSALFLHEMLFSNGLSLPTGKLDCVHRMSWCLPFSVYQPTVSLLQQQTTLEEKLIPNPRKVMTVTCPPNRFCFLYWKDKGKQLCKDSPFFIVSGCFRGSREAYGFFPFCEYTEHLLYTNSFHVPLGNGFSDAPVAGETVS